MELIAIVSIAAAVLQIVLFFKVWGMCNNVKKISSKLGSNQNSFWAVRRALIIGDKEAAKQLLTEQLLDDIQDIYTSAHTHSAYGDNPYSDKNNNNIQKMEQIMEQRIWQYKDRFSKIGAEMPEITVRSKKDIDNLV